MGDYTQKGFKIGTCGNAYYATKKMIEVEYLAGDHGSDVSYYLNKEQYISFAFPFPEYDGKRIGGISNFHEGQRVDFFFKFDGDGCHDTICHHVHPKGGVGVNVFVPCPCSEHSQTSNNFDKKADQTFRLVSQINSEKNGKLFIAAECIYCKTMNVFSKSEALQVAKNILTDAQWFVRYAKTSNLEDNVKKALYFKLIAERIILTYKNH